MPLTWSNEQENGQPFPRRKNGTNFNMSINKQIKKSRADGNTLLSEELTNLRNARKGYSTTPRKSFWKRCTNALTCSSSPNNVENPALYGPLPKILTPNATGPSALSVRNYPPLTPVTNVGEYSQIGKRLRNNIPVQPTTPLNNNYTRAKSKRHLNNNTRKNARILAPNNRLLHSLKDTRIYKNFGGSRKRTSRKLRRSRKI